VGRRVLVNVEIKTEFAESSGLQATVAACIVRHQMQERVLVSSFNPRALARFRAVLPDVPLGYLYEGESTTLPADAVYEAYHPQHAMLTPRLVEQCRQHRQMLNVWTINDPARAIELQALGVHGIITDRPDTIREALALLKL
jgi:glycerophosphoryl diester phosphodiesterase